MNTFKKILAWFLVVISIAGILVCVTGLVGTWVVKDRVTTRILALLTNVQSGLTRVEESLTAAGSQITNANAAVTAIREATTQLGDRVEENTPVLDKITNVLNQDLQPSIKKVQDLVLPIWERILAINNTIEALNTFPGINLPTLTPQMEALNDQVQKAIDTVQQLQANIADFKTGVVKNVLDPFLAKLDTLSAFLTRIEQDVASYLEQIDLIQAAVTNLQATIPSTINAAAIIISILLISSILGQVSLILLSGLYLRTGQLVWKLKAPEQAAAEALSP